MQINMLKCFGCSTVRNYSMDKSFGSQKKAFSMAYAMVALVVTAIAIVGLTPILTRKIANIPTSMAIKNVQGWYESYYALPVGEEYCSSCMRDDKNNSPWKEPYTFSVITKDEEGDPSYNPYAKNIVKPELNLPDPLVPYEKYCKSNGKCGYPEDKWDDEERNSINKPDPNKPHRCKKNGCKFKPTSGVSKFELYAVGGGGASGSAVNNNPTSVSASYNNLVKGKFNASSDRPLKSGNPTIDNKLKINSDFIDVYRTNDNGNILTDQNARGNFYTVGENTNNINADNIDDLDSDKHNRIKGNFHIYPTKAWSETLAKSSSKQMEKILKDNNKPADKNIVNRFYLYTKTVGAYNLMYNPPEYTLMPEWLKMDGSEHLYSCLDGIEKNCSPSDTISTTQTAVTQKYDTALAVACSGNGGKGANVMYSAYTVCGWMKGNGCAKGEIKFDHPYGLKAYEVEMELAEGASEYSCPATDNPCYTGSDSDEQLCYYNAYYTNRSCGYKPYKNYYVTCTCTYKKKPFLNTCDGNDDMMEKCYPEKQTVPVDPNDTSNIDNALAEARKMGTTLTYTNYLGEEVTLLGAYDSTALTYSGYDEHGGDSVSDVSSMQDTVINSAFDVDGYEENVQTSLMDAATSLAEASETTDPNKASELMVEAHRQLANARNTKRKLENVQDQFTFEENTASGLNNVDMQCTAIHPYTKYAYGGAGGKGICAYRLEKIEKEKHTSIESVSTQNVGGAKLNKSCGSGTSGGSAGNAKACINNVCRVASGGGGGGGGVVDCDLCNGSSRNGSSGSDGSLSGSGNGGSFPKSEISASDTSLGTGTYKKSGMYNWHYIWYMPYITKHLMFGTAGNSGEEVHTTITLSEGTVLSITPGKGAAKTDYTSGKNGLNGSASTVENKEAKISFTAHGGQGGTGSQKTDEYLLCHVSDRQSADKNKPCYYKDSNDNDFKKTHYITKNNEFKGIQAIKYNFAPSVELFSANISKELKLANPGMGAMGYGTESVSDFICEKRHLDKADDAPVSDVIAHPGSLSEVEKYCKGNSKIKYILPNEAHYTPSTGAVIIWW